MIDEKVRRAREFLMPVAVVEHQSMIGTKLSTYDICDRLWPIWEDIENDAKSGHLRFDVDYIFKLNVRISSSIDVEVGEFKNKESWLEFIESCGDIEEDPLHVFSWIFSELYWNRLTRTRLATSWIFISGMRIKYGFPLYSLSLKKLGLFLYSLSGSGPSLYDGQTFYLDDFSDKNT